MSGTEEPPRFSCFNSLPPELRHMIWDFALPDDTPELYRRPLQPTSTSKAPGSTGPLTVSTGYPVLMHVSREARHRALARTQLRPSAVAGCRIASRALRPELDIVQVSYSGVAPLLWLPAAWQQPGGLAAQLQHVAVEANTLTSYMRAQLADALPHLRSLRSLRVIFMSAAAPLQIGEELIPCRPAGRCALQPFTFGGDEKKKKTKTKLRGTVVSVKGTCRLDCDLDFLYNHLQELVRARLPLWGDDVRIAAWDYEAQTLKLRIVAQVMVHYQLSDGTPSWVEVGDA
ncbi:hypothetical protein GGR54DRAFT_27934 [Hypoxylon sp. NC1633]|nr:hypothetical protein GGR54DRAFT_27934 [Hypoxylon sp. NC1633]